MVYYILFLINGRCSRQRRNVASAPDGGVTLVPVLTTAQKATVNSNYVETERPTYALGEARVPPVLAGEFSVVAHNDQATGMRQAVGRGVTEIGKVRKCCAGRINRVNRHAGGPSPTTAVNPRPGVLVRT
jgi:hypothetical protein